VKPDERIAALQRIPLFAEVPAKDLRAVAEALSVRAFSAGATIASQGTRGIGFFMIETGEADVVVDGGAVRRLGPGDYFGEIALLTEGTRTASVTAVTDLSCLVLDAWHFRPLLRGNPELSWALLQALAKQVTGDS
jgi:CRP-like cAMP-binding protein